MNHPPKGKADFFLRGDHNANCSMCGGKFKASQLTKHWQGGYRCSSCFEPRHPQDFVRPVPIEQPPPWIQVISYVDAATCTPNGTSAIPARAVPGCTVPGYLSPFFDADVTA